MATHKEKQRLLREYRRKQEDLVSIQQSAETLRNHFIAERQEIARLRQELDKREASLSETIEFMRQIPAPSPHARRSLKTIRQEVLDFLMFNPGKRFTSKQLQDQFPSLKDRVVALVLRIPVAQGIIQLDKSVQGRQNTRYYIPAK